MFTLSAAPVTFVGLLLLFSFTTCWEVVRLLRAGDARGRTSSALHLLMSVVMLLMVPPTWYRPFSRLVPMGAQVALMAVGAVWFIVLAVRARPGHRAHAAGCAVMFTAMVWHLSAMHVHMSHMMQMSQEHSMDGMQHMAPMGPSWMETASRPGGTLWWFAVVGVVLMAALLWLAVGDALAVLRRRGHRVDHLAGCAMNLGMFWMSTGLLAPLMPWITALRI